MRFIAALTIASALAAVPVVAQQQGQDPFVKQVREQLAAVEKELRPKGYELTYQVYTGSLKDGATEMVTFRLRRGVRYAISGVCDQDCGDLDLRLLDPNDKEVVKDVGKDDVPVVELIADKSGEYTLKVEMAECADEPCWYGVGVFAAGQDEFERQVRGQLEAVGKRLAADGFRLTHHIFTGNLKEKEFENVVFELEKGGTYVILGVCDNDCKDVDLQLLNSRGRQIDKDEDLDDNPVVGVAPEQNERYTVRAVMASCSQSPCRYGLGVFRK